MVDIIGIDKCIPISTSIAICFVKTIIIYGGNAFTVNIAQFKKNI